MQDVLDKPRRGDTPPAAPATRPASRRRRNPRARWALTARITALSIFSLLLLFPFVWLVSQSLKDTNQYFAVPFEWIPSPFRWENFTDVIFKYEFLHYIGNSLWLALYAVVVNILSSSFVAYGFSRFRVPGRGLYLNEKALAKPMSATSRIVSSKSSSVSPGKPTMKSPERAMSGRARRTRSIRRR